MAHVIDEAAVRHIAHLARLKLSPDEVRRFTGQLESILVYVKQLDALDTAHVEPATHALPLTNVLRDDVPREPLGVDRALANAPRREGSFFALPKVLDQEGA